ncbi:MAG TPA: CheR family methyltransferase, partial [Polyangiaceae bacterium]|nr:CheR family methyltransferase [Polyangiaceae bacterium]
RRVARRMAVHRMATLEEYVRLLREDPAEVHALFDDLLIHVTAFFRDAEAFEKLKEHAFPEILNRKRDGGVIRIWCAGCSTGEEAYSLVIALLEFLGQEKATDVPIRLFGTDISEKAIEQARSGLYSEAVARDVGADRLARYFTKVETGGYRINKSVRDCCAFVKHDLGSDPPFSKLDLVSCRNVLIYFGQELQRRVLAAFHFALNEPGFLLLGHAENIADGVQLFAPVDKANKIFSRTAVKSALRLVPTRDVLPAVARPVAPRGRAAVPLDLVKRAESVLLDQYAPPGVIINERMEILQFRGRTGPYLEPAPGQPQNDLLKMARRGLMPDLRMAISKALKDRVTVRRAGVSVGQNGSTRLCDVVVVPIASPPEAREHTFAVLFEEPRAVPPPEKPTRRGTKARPAPGKKADDRRVERLERELTANKEYLRSIIEEHERTNEELMAANEELISSNEELQSLNEELETAKEELQSTNEELRTLNEELQTRNVELDAVNGDLFNILGAVEVPIVIVDSKRRIRRFTPKARPILNLLASDVGRPIEDIKPSLGVEDLDQKIAEVVDTVTVHEEEVQGRDGHWYRLQIRPYTTVDKRIDGAVLSVVDIDALKRALAAAEWSRDYAKATVEALQTPVLVLDATLQILWANEAFHERYGVSQNESEGRNLYEIMGGAWDLPALRSGLGGVLEGSSGFVRLEAEAEIPRLGKRAVSLSGRALPAPTGDKLIVLAAEDITERRRAEAERARMLEDTEAAKASAEQANRTKDIFLATLSHELRTPLSTLLMQSQLLQRGPVDDARLKKAAESIERATKAQAQLVDDLLDISRIVTGKLKLELQEVHVASVVRAAAETVGPTAEKGGVDVELHLDEALAVAGDSQRLQQVVLNLLTNAIKFTPQRGRVTVTVDSVDGRARLRVSDTGIGIEPQFLPHVFDRFTQEDRLHTRAHAGLGLGLAIVRYLVDAHGGSVRAESGGRGKGTTFTVLLPLMKERGKLVPAHAEREPARSSRKVPVASLDGVRILVVDDNAGAREALTEMLRMSGARVRSAESAAQALGIQEEFRPQLLVCDIAMPEEDGYSLLRRIRALGPKRGGDVPALALTALASEADRRSATAAGFQMHLAKPVGIDALLAALVELLNRPATGAETHPPAS